MAPPKLYSDPHEQLVELLRVARDAGVVFDVAWEAAIRPGKAVVMTTTKNAPADAIRWPTDSTERIGWQQALVACRDHYRRAFERRPATRRERAVVVLLAAVDVPRRDMPVAPRVLSAA